MAKWIKIEDSSAEVAERVVKSSEVVEVRRTTISQKIEVRMQGQTEWLVAHDPITESLTDFAALLSELDFGDSA